MATTLHPSPQTDNVSTAPAAARPGRWTLSRAGIINVYQYGDETLDFGGGRLLLRGVNGSGKSTAMNMLLPFLLDADTRRIDAAGEQSGVLRGWMLSGRNEAQPVGYLWLEVAKDDGYLSFGCGIRANRSTDQVTTWWFVTQRRPGIDFPLVETRVPVSRDALKSLVEPDPVFGQDQRAQYRAELRKRLFGGADIEQHLQLLRIVRNPRVGDRLDSELPQYLHDALPQLSDSALDDAAQPLEDLEEHRRNVADLERTAEALDAIYGTYRSYARAELHRMADGTAQAVRGSRECRRKEEETRAAHDAANERRHNARARKEQLGADAERLQTTIRALEASEAYKSGAQLNDLRERVESLARTEAAARDSLLRRESATQRAADDVRGAQQEAMEDHAVLRERLADIASAASACRLAARPPPAPLIAADPCSPPQLEFAPRDALETPVGERALSALSLAARQRRDESEAVTAALRAVEPAERALRAAEAKSAEAATARDTARTALADARTVFQAAVETWYSDAAAWLERLRQHHALHTLGPLEDLPAIGAVVDEIVLGRALSLPLEALTVPAVRQHEMQRAKSVAALQRQDEVVAKLERQAAELATKTLPDPPMLGWQQRTRRSFAELVDFAAHVDDEARAGLEAALEASGLLAAEVHDDGTLRLADGQLVIAPGSNASAGDVPAPLRTLLAPDVLNDDAGASVHATLERILHAISTDSTAHADTIVTAAGEFRLGAVRGKHTKERVEHIGVTARRAALERQRAENALALAEAKGEQDGLAAAVESAQAALEQAIALRNAIPSDRPLHAGLWRRTEAEKALQTAEKRWHARRAESESAERRHVEAVTHARTTASRLGLPASFDELAALRVDLDRLTQDAREAQREFARLAAALDRWRRRGDEWLEARADAQRSEENLAAVAAELRATRERLATLDATIGTAYADVVARITLSTVELNAARSALKGAEQELEVAVRDFTGAEKDRESATAARVRADDECVATLHVFKRALTVPGLLDAALDSPDDPEGASQDAASDAPVPPDTSAPAARAAEAFAVELATVEESPAGARRLVDTIRARVPRATEAQATADSVRQSIRRRRDSLGAGWDADDRQPDASLPLHVAVTGPLARETPLPNAAQTVHGQLATMSSLLTTKQHQALRNLLQGLVAREVAEKLHGAEELIRRMNERLTAIKTSHGIGVSLRWRHRDDLDPETAATMALLARPPDLRTANEDTRLTAALGRRIDEAHREDPGTPYRDLIARVLDYRAWHAMTIVLHRPGRSPERLGRRTALSEGEKKIVSYLPLFAAVAASCDALGASAPEAPRFVLLDDAFAKVSEDNHAKLFGLLVELDLDFIATSERLWGTHDTVPELAITEVIRDADLQTIVLEHSRWKSPREELPR